MRQEAALLNPIPKTNNNAAPCAGHYPDVKIVRWQIEMGDW
jgi:hypothetical protein